MPQIVSTGGHRNWSMQRDADGHRNYVIVFRVQVDNPGEDGPHTALYFTPGLPTPGDPWLHNNDLDLWAHCTKEVSVAEHQDKPGAPVKFFDLTFRFTTRPDKVCQDAEIEDPLLEPPKISGGSIKYTEEATHDRFGALLLTSSHELIRGPQVEFDHGRDQVRISHVVPILQWALCTSMRDTVNGYTLWGFPRRCVKLSDFTWDILYRGKCQVYYRRNYVFDISYKFNPFTGLIESGFDRTVADEGTKALNGKYNQERQWELININGEAPNPNNPHHFKRYTDPSGNMQRVLLNGAGIPAGAVVVGQGYMISITDNNTGNDLSDSTKWIPYLGPTDNSDPAEYDSLIIYRQGQAVMLSTDVDPTKNGMYVCLQTANDKYPGTQTTYWLKLPAGYDVLGTYDGATTYGKGDVVQGTTGSGSRRIEKYTESDFLLLGIPALIGP